MDDIMELKELDFDNFDGSGKGSGGGSSGGGLELLMNSKVKDSSKANADIDLEDLNRLENELNDLVEDDTIHLGTAPRSDLFDTKPNISFKFEDNEHEHDFGGNNNDGGIHLGKDTFNTAGDEKTWDGYGKFNNIPLNPDKAFPTEPKLSNEEIMREKFKYLRKLEQLEKKGVELSKKYNMESSLQEMIGEYETIMEEKTKQNAVKFQGNMMMAVINGLEFLNNKFDPFDIKLDGWSDQIQENISDYDDIFAELHEKYKGKASWSPELKLLFQLGGSAMMVHMTNTMFKSAMPGMDDIFRQNPDLMRSFQTAAVNTMAQSNPGFSGFMSNIMQPEPQVPRGNGPPPPIATQGPGAISPPSGRPGNNNFSRPDLNFSRSNFMDENVPLRSPVPPHRNSRPEMKGPSDISDILSGLKTKKINIQEQQSSAPEIPTSMQNPYGQSTQSNTAQSQNEASTISINDLKDLQANDATMPKRSGRRKKSSSNTVSLDI